MATDRTPTPEELAEAWRGRAVEARETHAEEEERAIRAALEAADWYIARAARALGVPRRTLGSIIARRYPDLAAEAEANRTAAGWTGGRPRARIGAPTRTRRPR